MIEVNFYVLKTKMESSVTVENNNFDIDALMAGAGKMTDDEVFRSMKIDQGSKTPYSDATQVRKLFKIDAENFFLGATDKICNGYLS